MGIGPKCGISYYSDSELRSEKAAPVSKIKKNINPDPYKFKVLKEVRYSKFSAVMVRYEGCTNYEGKKVIVLRWVGKSKSAGGLERLDPHFSKTGNPRVVARFEPTPLGFEDAVQYASLRNKDHLRRVR